MSSEKEEKNSKKKKKEKRFYTDLYILTFVHLELLDNIDG